MILQLGIEEDDDDDDDIIGLFSVAVVVMAVFAIHDVETKEREPDARLLPEVGPLRGEKAWLLYQGGVAIRKRRRIIKACRRVLLGK